jgi:outer membrane protein assembly factor BamB
VRGKAEKYFFHGDIFIAPDWIVASSDVVPSAGAEAGVHAFDRDSGRELWKYPAGRGVLGAVIGAGPRVFAYAANGDLIALNLESGKRKWSYALNAGAWESPAVVGDRVFAGSNDGSVYAFNSETGRVEWKQKLGAAVSTSIRAAPSDVYAGTADGTVYRLDPSTGDIRSSLKLDPTLRPFSAPLLTANAVLVLLADQQAEYRALVSIDPSLGRVNWRQAAPDRWTTSRVFATRRAAFVGTPSGEVAAYCLADGSAAWSHKLANAQIRSIGGSDEILYVGTPEGTLYAIRPPQFCM